MVVPRVVVGKGDFATLLHHCHCGQKIAYWFVQWWQLWAVGFWVTLQFRFNMVEIW